MVNINSCREPQRMCLGCRGRDRKEVLLRVVWDGANAVVDEKMRMQGRGAYFHVRPECISRGLDSKKIRHALRLADGDEVEKKQLEEVKSRLVSKFV